MKPDLFTTREGGAYRLWDYGEITNDALVIPKTNLISLVGYIRINHILLHSLLWLKDGITLKETNGKFLYVLRRDFKAQWDCFNGWTQGENDVRRI